MNLTPSAASLSCIVHCTQQQEYSATPMPQHAYSTCCSVDAPDLHVSESLSLWRLKAHVLQGVSVFTAQVGNWPQKDQAMATTSSTCQSVFDKSETLAKSNGLRVQNSNFTPLTANTSPNLPSLASSVTFHTADRSSQ